MLGASLLGTTRLSAQSGGEYRITASVIAGGGGTSTGGMFAVTGTLGQPVAGGPLNGGTFTLGSGFWNVIQTPGAPLLRITRTAAGGAIVSWPAPSEGWVLQQTMSVSTQPTIVWTDVTSPSVVVVAGENTVTFPTTTGSRYFRLRHP
jgi:hypothetical protein